MKIPDNTFIQKIHISFDVLKKSVPIFIVFGMFDNMEKSFNHDDWTIMNENWIEFSKKTMIEEFDLWDKNIVRIKKKNLFFILFFVFTKGT